ncbi:MAG: hypothetical protein V4725_02780 [Bacteroidota bacterium]
MTTNEMSKKLWAKDLFKHWFTELMTLQKETRQSLGIIKIKAYINTANQIKPL